MCCLCHRELTDTVVSALLKLAYLRLKPKFPVWFRVLHDLMLLECPCMLSTLYICSDFSYPSEGGILPLPCGLGRSGVLYLPCLLHTQHHHHKSHFLLCFVRPIPEVLE